MDIEHGQAPSSAQLALGKQSSKAGFFKIDRDKGANNGIYNP
jgi:hypothetical protein